jgi:hypothetical protein
MKAHGCTGELGRGTSEARTVASEAGTHPSLLRWGFAQITEPAHKSRELPKRSIVQVGGSRPFRAHAMSGTGRLRSGCVPEPW